MRVVDAIAQSRTSMNAREVFGQPYEKNGLTIIPAARVTGGAGGGGDQQEPQSGGMGFGFMAQQAGAFIKDNEVSWQPAVDINRIVLFGQVIGLIAVLTIGSIARAMIRRRPQGEAQK